MQCYLPSFTNDNTYISICLALQDIAITFIDNIKFNQYHYLRHTKIERKTNKAVSPITTMHKDVQ